MAGLNLMGRITIFFDVVDPGAVASLRRLERATKNVQRATGDASLANTRARGSFKDLAGAFTAMWVGREAARAILAGVMPAVRLQEAMKRLQAEVGGTEEQLKELRRAALSAAAATAFTPTEAIEGLRLLRKASLDVTTAAGVIAPVLQLAQAQNLNVAETARTAGTLYKQFGWEVEQITLAFDQYLKLAVTLGFETDNLLRVTTRLAQVAKTTGNEYSDLVIVFGLANVAFASNRRESMAILRLVESLSSAEARFNVERTFGVQVTKRGTSQMRSMADIMAEISEIPWVDPTRMATFRDQMAGLGVARVGLRAFEAGITRLRTGMQLANGQLITGTVMLAHLRVQARMAGGTLREMSDVVLESASRAFEELSESIEGLFAGMGMGTVELFASVFKGLTAAITWVRETVEDLPAPLSAALSLLYGVVTVGGLLFAGLLILGGAWVILSSAVKKTLVPMYQYIAASKIVVWTNGRLAASTAVASKGFFGLGAAARSLGTVFIWVLAAVASLAAGFVLAASWMSLIGKSMEKITGNDNHLTFWSKLISGEEDLNGLLVEASAFWDELVDGMDSAGAAARRVTRVMEEEATQQEEVNAAIAQYNKITSEASTDFPPRIVISQLEETRRLLDSLNLSSGQQRRFQEAAQAQYAEYIATLREGLVAGELTDEQNARQARRLAKIATLMHNLNGVSRDQTKNIRDMSQAHLAAVSTGGRYAAAMMASTGAVEGADAAAARQLLGTTQLNDALERLARVMERVARIQEGQEARATPTLAARRTRVLARGRRGHGFGVFGLPGSIGRVLMQTHARETTQRRIRGAAALGVAGPSELPTSAAAVAPEQLETAARILKVSVEQLRMQLDTGFTIRVESVDSGEDTPSTRPAGWARAGGIH